MSYQQADFGEINREESPSSYPGYAPSNDYSSQSSEQRLSESASKKDPSSNQRLLLAIGSLFLLLVALTMVTITTAITNPGLLLPILVICLTFFFTGFLFVNIQFNRNKGETQSQ